MYYHASPTAGIQVLEPRVSNHGVPLVYFSQKRENVLPYLSNAVEKYCRDTGFTHSGKWTKWGPYGFKNGILELQEYYPNALRETYQGVSGYIYYARSIQEAGRDIAIPDAAASSLPVPVDGAEFVPDAYEAILAAERSGSILIARYEDLSDKMHAWIRETIRKEYDDGAEQPEYRYFLGHKFEFIRQPRPGTGGGTSHGV